MESLSTSVKWKRIYFPISNLRSDSKARGTLHK